MKMNKEDLIKARLITQKLLTYSLKTFGVSAILLITITMLCSIFTPHVLNKVGFIVIFLFGLVFGIVIGTLEAYNIFWEQIEFKEA